MLTQDKDQTCERIFLRTSLKVLSDVNEDKEGISSLFYFLSSSAMQYLQYIVDQISCIFRILFQKEKNETLIGLC